MKTYFILLAATLISSFSFAQEGRSLAIEKPSQKMDRQEQDQWNAMTKICLHKINTQKDISDNQDKQALVNQMMSCISQIKKIDFSEKAQDCTFQEGVAIDCPEGVYTFNGNKGLTKVNEEARHIVKEISGSNVDSRLKKIKASQK